MAMRRSLLPYITLCYGSNIADRKYE